MFPNQKTYIGITSQNVFRRWQRGKGYKKARVYDAICKYGWDNIEHIILSKNLNKEQAKKEEIAAINKYKSNKKDFGYNVSEGGFVPVITDETKEKLRIANLGKIQSKETVAKRVEKLRGQKRPTVSLFMQERKGSKNPNYGKKAPDRVRKALSNHAKYGQFGANNYSAKSVIQYDKNNNYITEYSTIIEAVQKLNLKSNHISECCRGKYKTAHGYIWKYKEA